MAGNGDVPTRHVVISIGRNGVGSILVDGVDFAAIVTRLVVTCEAGRPPLVDLYCKVGLADIDVEAELKVSDA